MNKYLILFLSLFVSIDVFASVTRTVLTDEIQINITNESDIDFNTIRNMDGTKYIISNSSIVINNFSDWQNWDEHPMTFDPIVVLYIDDLDISMSGEKVNHLKSVDKENVTIQDTNRLYRTRLDSEESSVYLYLVRETNYEKVFNNSRGIFLEGIRSNNPNDKMLLAMDRATNMNEINSIMNSSYHFSPIILMNPIKTINRSRLLDLFEDIKHTGTGANFDYIFSDKINNFGTRFYMDNKYEDLYFRIGINLNSFSYSDDFNEFTGLNYGLDIHAKQYVDDFWFDGLVGLGRTNFKTDNIYVNDNISNNPKGMSEYLRLNVGYDYTKISEFVISPFTGFMLQRYEVMNFNDTDLNLYTGITAKYNYSMDGIKYGYSANVATDEKANWNIGFNVGFLSVVDKVGASISINAFKDEFAVNYKLSLNAKIQF
jgi:hypothetical protein